MNKINNITSELKKISVNNPFNYMKENPDFDFNNNKLGIYLLLQQNGKSGKIYVNGGENKENGLSTRFKRCNEHMRRKILKNKDIEVGIYKNSRDKDRIDLASIQFIFSGLINKKKYKFKSFF